MNSSVEIICIAVGIGIAVPTLNNVMRRRRGDRGATTRSLAIDLATSVPFMLCAALSIAYHRLHWLLFVAVAISVATFGWQLLKFRRARNRARSEVDG